MTDNLTPAQRSYCMSRVRNRDTGLEREVCSALQRRGLRFRKHLRHLPGSPDVVFARARVAVYIDGDFWHGLRFPIWRDQVSTFWQSKIEKNRRRDRRNFQIMRRRGWKVVRIWQSAMKSDFDGCVLRIVRAVNHSRLSRP